MNNQRRAPKLSDYTPQSVWSYAVPSGWSINGGVFDNGKVFVSLMNNDTLTGAISARDAQTHAKLWKYSENGTGFSTACVANGILYTSDNGSRNIGNILAFSTDLGQMQWRIRQNPLR